VVALDASLSTLGAGGVGGSSEEFGIGGCFLERRLDFL
jgi:hypothetical protein